MKKYQFYDSKAQKCNFLDSYAGKYNFQVFKAEKNYFFLNPKQKYIIFSRF